MPPPWRWGVPKPKWRPGHYVSAHHFDRQPALAYVPGAIAIALAFGYNARRPAAPDESDSDEAAAPPVLAPAPAAQEDKVKTR